MRPARLLPLALALLFSPRPARAEPPPRVSVRLDYARGPGGEVCPAESVLHDEVARRMGYDPFDPGAGERLTLVVARQGRGFAARLERFDARGARTWSDTFPVRGDDCALLVSGVASYVRALLAPVQGPPGKEPARGPLFRVEGYAGRAEPPPLVTPMAALPPPAPGRALRFELAADAHITLTGAPAVTGGGTVRAALRWPWFSLGAEGRFDAPASANASDIAGSPRAQYSAYTFTGSIAPCAYYPNPHVQPFGCGVISAGAMTAESHGAALPERYTRFVFMTGPRVGLDIPMTSRLALRASFDALFFVGVPLIRVAGAELWKSGVVSGIGSLGLAFFF